MLTKIFYTSFDKPKKNENTKNKIEYFYGPSNEKILRLDENLVSGEEKSTRFYGNDLEKVESKEGITYKIYIGSNAIITKSKGKPKTYDYFVKDHIGSLVAVFNDKEEIKEQFYYDPWGKKIKVEDYEYLWGENLKPKLYENYVTNRGFTGHEQFELIHMGGRVYDYISGRFLSADPFVNGSGTAQSFNRYSYVENNPLSYTDPSGYFLHKSLKKAGKWVNKNKKSIVTITVLVAVTGGAAVGTL